MERAPSLPFSWWHRHSCLCIFYGVFFCRDAMCRARFCALKGRMYDSAAQRAANRRRENKTPSPRRLWRGGGAGEGAIVRSAGVARSYHPRALSARILSHSSRWKRKIQTVKKRACPRWSSDRRRKMQTVRLRESDFSDGVVEAVGNQEVSTSI